jgi:PEGA domain-containing protein
MREVTGLQLEVGVPERRNGWKRILKSLALLVLVVLSAHLAAQTFSTPQGRVENVRTSRSGSVYTFIFDLVVTSGDASTAVFDITVKAIAAGQPLNVKTLSGDVANIRAGKDRRIVWDAGQDVETRNYDSFTFDVIAVGGRLIEARGKLQVKSTPAGAAVFVDGQSVGVTPFNGDIATGRHQVSVRQTGFSEKGDNNVTIRTGQTTTLDWTLTPTGDPSAKSGGGGSKKWIFIGAGGAAAAAGAALGLKKDGGGGGCARSYLPSPSCTCPAGTIDTGSACASVPQCSFSLSASSFTAPSSAAAQTPVTITVSPSGCSNPSWTAMNGSFWSVSPLSGTGTTNVTVSVGANTTPNAHNDNLTIAGRPFACSQPGITCSFDHGSGANNFDTEPYNTCDDAPPQWISNPGPGPYTGQKFGWCVDGGGSGVSGAQPRHFSIVPSNAACTAQPRIVRAEDFWVHLNTSTSGGTTIVTITYDANPSTTAGRYALVSLDVGTPYELAQFVVAQKHR